MILVSATPQKVHAVLRKAGVPRAKWSQGRVHARVSEGYGVRKSAVPQRVIIDVYASSACYGAGKSREFAAEQEAAIAARVREALAAAGLELKVRGTGALDKERPEGSNSSAGFESPPAAILP